MAHEYNGAHIRIPAAALRQGGNTLRLTFTTPIAAAGASIINYRDTGDGSTFCVDFR